MGRREGKRVRSSGEEGGKAAAESPAQEHDGSGNVVAVTQAAQRHSVAKSDALLPVCSRATQTRKPFCFPYDSWSNAHHPHTRRSPFTGQVAGEHVDACFSRAGMQLVHDAAGKWL